MSSKCDSSQGNAETLLFKACDLKTGQQYPYFIKAVLQTHCLYLECLCPYFILYYRHCCQYVSNRWNSKNVYQYLIQSEICLSLRSRRVSYLKIIGNKRSILNLLDVNIILNIQFRKHVKFRQNQIMWCRLSYIDP